MKTEQFGPNQQSMTGHIAYCGAEFSEFLGAHNPECPHFHNCGCSPKHSSSLICHRCSCKECDRVKAEYAELKVSGWVKQNADRCVVARAILDMAIEKRQLELFDMPLDV